MTKKLFCFRLKDQEQNLKDKLYITFNSGDTAPTDKFSNRHDRQELEQVKIYLRKNNKEVLNYSELSASFSVNSSCNPNKVI